jgi:hypothetical protein
MTDVTGKIFEWADAAGLSNPVSDLTHPTQGDQRAPTGRIRIDAAGDSRSDILFDVK